MTSEAMDNALELIRRYYVAMVAYEETGDPETLGELGELRSRLEAIPEARMDAGTNRAP